MVEPLESLPAGALGYRFSGKVTREEYDSMLATIRERLERGEPLDILIETGPDFDGFELAALWDDLKAAGSVGLKHRSSWRRSAIVTGNDAMRHAMGALGWLMPGELRVFDPDERGDAIAWLAGD